MAWIDKNGYRERLLAQRDALPEDARTIADQELYKRVVKLPEWQQAKLVLSYLSFGSEVETRWYFVEALEQGKLFALPRCVGTGDAKHLEWHVVKSLEGLEESAFGMLEPASDPKTLVGEVAFPAAIALVPGLAFDGRGFRLGYGAGFYDRFLAGFTGKSVGLCREVALQVELPSIEEHDIPVQKVVTESRVIEPSAYRKL